MSTAFLLTTVVIVATPGTDVRYTLATGLSRGARASVVAAFGCTLGIVPHMVAAITGLAAPLNVSAVAFPTLNKLERLQGDPPSAWPRPLGLLLRSTPVPRRALNRHCSLSAFCATP